MKETTIMVFGDSITYGAADFEQGGWVNRLRLHYDKKYEYDYMVFNLGISGTVTEETLARFESECSTRYKEDQRILIIFAIGINDTQMINGKERVSIDQFESNIEELISKAKQFTKDILFIGLTKVEESKVVPFPWNPNKSCFNERIIRFDNTVEKICINEKVSYIKMYDLLSLDELEDGLHPTSIGHQKMYNAILDKIDSIIG